MACVVSLCVCFSPRHFPRPQLSSRRQRASRPLHDSATFHHAASDPARARPSVPTSDLCRRDNFNTRGGSSPLTLALENSLPSSLRSGAPQCKCAFWRKSGEKKKHEPLNFSPGTNLATAEVSSPENPRGCGGESGTKTRREFLWKRFLTADEVQRVDPTSRFLVADTLLSGNMEARLPATLSACQSPTTPS